MDSVKYYLKDSFKYILKNVPVTVNEINQTQVGEVNAFHAKFEDKLKHEYWMEFDYPISDTSSLKKNQAYKLLKDMRVNSDTILSFFYLGDVEWKDSYSDYLNELRIRVVPFPKDFNFDSSRKANTPAKL